MKSFRSISLNVIFRILWKLWLLMINSNSLCHYLPGLKKLSSSSLRSKIGGKMSFYLFGLIYRTTLVQINVTPFVSLSCVYFVRAILCLKIECCGRLDAFECGLKIVKCNFFFCSGPRTTSNYSEPRFHESFVMNSCKEKQLFPWPRPILTITWVFAQSILGTNVGKNNQPVKNYRCIVRGVKYLYKKTYLSFRFVTSRPLCQIKLRDQTLSMKGLWRYRRRSFTLSSTIQCQWTGGRFLQRNSEMKVVRVSKSVDQTKPEVTAGNYN